MIKSSIFKVLFLLLVGFLAFVSCAGNNQIGNISPSILSSISAYIPPSLKDVFQDTESTNTFFFALFLSFGWFWSIGNFFSLYTMFFGILFSLIFVLWRQLNTKYPQVMANPIQWSHTAFKLAGVPIYLTMICIVRLLTTGEYKKFFFNILFCVSLVLSYLLFKQKDYILSLVPKTTDPLVPRAILFAFLFFLMAFEWSSLSSDFDNPEKKNDVVTVLLIRYFSYFVVPLILLGVGNYQGEDPTLTSIYAGLLNTIIICLTMASKSHTDIGYLLFSYGILAGIPFLLDSFVKPNRNLCVNYCNDAENKTCPPQSPTDIASCPIDISGHLYLGIASIIGASAPRDLFQYKNILEQQRLRKLELQRRKAANTQLLQDIPQLITDLNTLGSHQQAAQALIALQQTLHPALLRLRLEEKVGGDVNVQLVAVLQLLAPIDAQSKEVLPLVAPQQAQLEQAVQATQQAVGNQIAPLTRKLKEFQRVVQGRLALSDKDLLQGLHDNQVKQLKSIQKLLNKKPAQIVNDMHNSPSLEAMTRIITELRGGNILELPIANRLTALITQASMNALPQLQELQELQELRTIVQRTRNEVKGPTGSIWYLKQIYFFVSIACTVFLANILSTTITEKHSILEKVAGTLLGIIVGRTLRSSQQGFTFPLFHLIDRYNLIFIIVFLVIGPFQKSVVPKLLEFAGIHIKH